MAYHARDRLLTEEELGAIKEQAQSGNVGSFEVARLLGHIRKVNEGLILAQSRRASEELVRAGKLERERVYRAALLEAEGREVNLERELEKANTECADAHNLLDGWALLGWMPCTAEVDRRALKARLGDLRNPARECVQAHKALSRLGVPVQLVRALEADNYAVPLDVTGGKPYTLTERIEMLAERTDPRIQPGDLVYQDNRGGYHKAVLDRLDSWQLPAFLEARLSESEYRGIRRGAGLRDPEVEIKLWLERQGFDLGRVITAEDDCETGQRVFRQQMGPGQELRSDP